MIDRKAIQKQIWDNFIMHVNDVTFKEHNKKHDTELTCKNFLGSIEKYERMYFESLKDNVEGKPM